MKPSRFFALCVLLYLTGCQSKTGENSPKDIQPIDTSLSTADSAVSENSNTEIPNSSQYKNPVMLPSGANIARFLQGYYLTGQFNEIRKFVVLKNGNDEDFNFKIKNIDWGYALVLTNCQWKDKNKFILTLKAMVNNTPRMEQYQGELVNDTAKLYFYCKNENPFLAR